jgi:hypothetical protein
MDIIVYDDYDDLIFNVFNEDFHEYCEECSVDSCDEPYLNNQIWNKYLRERSIGVEYLGMVSGKHEYLVKDKHKWFLSKIKYGV